MQKVICVPYGIAGEFEFGTNFECGFDTAFNFGHQTVFGWDRNAIKLENRDGAAVIVNSQVRPSPHQARLQRSKISACA